MHTITYSILHLDEDLAVDYADGSSTLPRERQMFNRRIDLDYRQNVFRADVLHQQKMRTTIQFIFVFYFCTTTRVADPDERKQQEEVVGV